MLKRIGGVVDRSKINIKVIFASNCESTVVSNLDFFFLSGRLPSAPVLLWATLRSVSSAVRQTQAFSTEDWQLHVHSAATRRRPWRKSHPLILMSFRHCLLYTFKFLSNYRPTFSCILKDRCVAHSSNRAFSILRQTLSHHQRPIMIIKATRWILHALSKFLDPCFPAENSIFYRDLLCPGSGLYCYIRNT